MGGPPRRGNVSEDGPFSAREDAPRVPEGVPSAAPTSRHAERPASVSSAYRFQDNEYPADTEGRAGRKFHAAARPRRLGRGCGADRGARRPRGGRSRRGFGLGGLQHQKGGPFDAGLRQGGAQEAVSGTEGDRGRGFGERPARYVLQQQRKAPETLRRISGPRRSFPAVAGLRTPAPSFPELRFRPVRGGPGRIGGRRCGNVPMPGSRPCHTANRFPNCCGLFPQCHKPRPTVRPFRQHRETERLFPAQNPPVHPGRRPFPARCGVRPNARPKGPSCIDDPLFPPDRDRPDVRRVGGRREALSPPGTEPCRNLRRAGATR